MEVAPVAGLYHFGRSLSQLVLAPTMLPLPVDVSPVGPAAFFPVGTASRVSVAG